MSTGGNSRDVNVKFESMKTIYVVMREFLRSHLFSLLAPSAINNSIPFSILKLN